MLHKLQNRIKEEKGFTLIELLVVILIIGILAAIAIPSFLNQRGKATDAKYKSAARTAQTAMETYFTDKNTYVGADATALQGIESTLNDPTSFVIATSGLSTTGYTVTATSPSDADGHVLDHPRGRWRRHPHVRGRREGLQRRYLVVLGTTAVFQRGGPPGPPRLR